MDLKYWGKRKLQITPNYVLINFPKKLFRKFNLPKGLSFYVFGIEERGKLVGVLYINTNKINRKPYHHIGKDWRKYFQDWDRIKNIVGLIEDLKQKIRSVNWYDTV